MGQSQTREPVMIEDVEKYQNRFTWLKDSKFLQDLENDSVDSELLDEELTALQEEEILTGIQFVTRDCWFHVSRRSRQKLVKFLQSNPVQILLCVVVLLDAGIVISQILLDLHSVREKLHKREDELSQLLGYIRATSGDALHGYKGTNINYILQMLSDHQRYEKYENLTEEKVFKSNKHQHSPQTPESELYSSSGSSKTRHQKTRSHESRGGGSTQGRRSSESQSDTSSRTGNVIYPNYMQSSGTSTQSGHGKTNQNKKKKQHSDAAAERMQSDSSDSGHHYSGSYADHSNAESDNISGQDCQSTECILQRHEVFHKNANYIHHVDLLLEHDTLHEVAHGLHFASIALLAFLVLEDLVKIVAMGKEFFKHKIEIFDAIIITCSLVFDVIFLGGVVGEEGEKAAAVLVVLLLWRITRVVDGIIITAKQRQEFRIKLQKRARRKAEKRIDHLEDEKHTRIRQICALQALCQRAGVTEDDIEMCTPKRPRRVSNTMCALSSVARLSVSMTMSMSSGLFSMVEDEQDKEDNKELSRTAADGEHKEEKLMIEFTRSEARRHSLPLPTCTAMSDIEEESSCSQRDDSESSPINSSGIRIIIDEGSDSDTESEGAGNRLLEVAESGSNDRRVSNISEVHLLG